MDVTPLIRNDAQVIQSYSDGKFRVSGQIYDTAIIVTSNSTFNWSKSAKTVAGLSVKDFDQVFEISDKIDVFLLGCGASMAFLSQELRNALKERGISVDVMDTGAACRTYNVLMAEGRRVAAVLFPA